MSRLLTLFLSACLSLSLHSSASLFLSFSLSLCVALSLPFSFFLFPPSLSLSLHSPCRDSSPRDSFRDSSGDSCRATRSFFFPFFFFFFFFFPPNFSRNRDEYFRGLQVHPLSLSFLPCSAPSPPDSGVGFLRDSRRIPEGFPKDSRRILEASRALP